MKYSRFGKSGLIIPKLAFRTMTFGRGPLVSELKNNINQPMWINAKTAEAHDE